MSTDTLAGGAVRAFDLDGAWQLHPQVSVRPERFGALLYHFGTRRLSFLKNPTLLERGPVAGLAHAAPAPRACDGRCVDRSSCRATAPRWPRSPRRTMIRERTEL